MTNSSPFESLARVSSFRWPLLMFYIAGDQVEQLLREHPHWEQRALNVVDVGAGKGLLARHLAQVCLS